jgi:hypothetical protein
MRWLTLVLTAATVLPAAATAQSGIGLPVIPPRAAPFPTTFFDQGGRERVTYNLDRSGGYVKGSNADTGLKWNADISAAGVITGTDVDGSRWRYDPKDRIYYNLTTHRTCAKTTVRRVCPS